MSTPLILLAIAVTAALMIGPAASQFNDSIPYQVKIVESGDGICPPVEELEIARTVIREEVEIHLRAALPGSSSTCGGTTGWTRVAYVDMSDSSQQCPGDLREVTHNGIRLCGRDSRADNTVGICTSAIFTTPDIPYDEVCGRIIGYHGGITSAFRYYTVEFSTNTIDEYYVDGVTLTHGAVGSREHIWTFVVGLEDDTDASHAIFICPCHPSASSSIVVPPFIEENYFCESGTFSFSSSVAFYDEPIWDGEGCSDGNSCCAFNNPPYFTRQLPASTSDDIELRNCAHYSGVHSTDTFIRFIELYIK